MSRRRIVPSCFAVLALHLLAAAAYGSGRAGIAVDPLPPPPANDDIAAATTIGVVPFIETLDTRSATASPGDPFCFGQAATVWYRYTLSPGPRIQRIDISTAGSSYPTTVSVYTGTPGSLVQITCSTTEASFAPTSGETYYVMVGSASGAVGGTLVLSVTGRPPLELFVSVDPGGLVMPRTNSATIRGTVFCTRPVTVRLAGQLLQDTEPTGVYAPFFRDLACTGSMAWSATVSPFEIGMIRPGPAEVSVRAMASDPETGETAEAQASATVTLRVRRRAVRPLREQGNERGVHLGVHNPRTVRHSSDRMDGKKATN